jgi:hypothetical protein
MVERHCDQWRHTGSICRPAELEACDYPGVVPADAEAEAITRQRENRSTGRLRDLPGGGRQDRAEQSLLRDAV